MIFFLGCARTISIYSFTKFHVFHNVTFFGSQNIYILHKWRAKIYMSSSRAKGLKG